MTEQASPVISVKEEKRLLQAQYIRARVQYGIYRILNSAHISHPEIREAYIEEGLQAFQDADQFIKDHGLDTDKPLNHW